MTSKLRVADESDIPPGVGKPALRAFATAGITRLAQFTAVTEADLRQLHGVGPKAIRLIQGALAARDQSFRPAVTQVQLKFRWCRSTRV